MIVVRALGPVDVSVNGAPAPARLLWKKNLALLIYLARSPKRVRTREHLIGLLWGEKPEEKARHSLNEALHVLRLSAGDDGFESDTAQVRIAPGTVDLDKEDRNVVGFLTEEGDLQLDTDKLALWTEPAFERDTIGYLRAQRG